MFGRLFRETPYERNQRRAEEAGLNTGCFFVVLLLGLVLWHTYQVSRIWESESWLKTAGRVVSSRSVPGTGPFSSYTDYADVAYVYTVAEREYKSRNLRWGSDYRLTRAGAAEEAARYPVYAEVEVYYDPDAPSDSVLERGFNRHFLFDVLLSLILISLAFVLMNLVFARTAKARMRYDSS
ncbi:MAG: DUF3592 domain-containing protein [Terriglobales bacterium]